MCSKSSRLTAACSLARLHSRTGSSTRLERYFVGRCYDGADAVAVAAAIAVTSAAVCCCGCMLLLLQ
eukprot:3948669-Prymnesium_polylepis.1